MRSEDTADSPEGGPAVGWNARLGESADWFATADALGDELVPELADWCAVHVRAGVVEALRAGAAMPLAELSQALPVPGEPLEMITLRHRDPEREPVIRHWAAEVPLHTGDAYGAGRVTATGTSRFLPQVPDGMLQSVVTDRDQQSNFQRFGVASSIVVPLCTSDGAVLGAMTLIRELESHAPFTEDDVHAAERFAQSAADALDSSRIATVTGEPALPDAGLRRMATWRPRQPRDAGVSAEGRAWARQTLPALLNREPSPELADDVDLVFTELISNAVRHGGGLREAQLADLGRHLRLVAVDNDPRRPAIRTRRADQPHGRGMHLIKAIADRWGTYRHHAEVGKRVWADLLVGDA
ncbi:GAF domain-containing protein [Actinoplanes oblitus]|uniref:GAF domain-containing protein n=1 Tax=Actinoplanes oblitus TaxID=3040509 RepID=A0ABY8WQJ5_9ACTN|nr:GAF domain-containing protein [Actinoplanes oblitus]WIM99923.1 GAF domain-containing protein [Actinoplanes oblitus]